ncbi:MAG: inorganic triphosphatase, partial [Burkholderiales bacterium PBB5]
ARSALRLRLEGQTWVQTLKAEGNSPLQRHEHEVVLPAGAEPLLDLARHDGSAAGAALRRVLAGAADATLVERYATEVQRTRRLLRSGGATIELALDEGGITAGRRRLPMSELELELLAGPAQALLAVAGRWAQRFGLLLDVRSKSERGQTLANAAADDPHPGLCAPVKARPLRLPADVGLAQALAAMLANPLQQVLANASSLCDGPAAPEHLHQLRVGLRRLRTVLRLYGP